ncbi:MAG: hypothetical protein ABIT37_04270 [Luteolibacter sp.]
MNNKDRLLRDLLGLYSKYGSASFSELAKQFRDPQFVKDATDLLESMVDALPKKRKPLRPSKGTTLSQRGDFITTLAKGDSELAHLLEKISRHFNGSQFRSIADIETFAEKFDITLPKATSLKTAKTVVLTHLKDLPLDQLEKVHTLLEHRSVPSDQSTLEGWSDIILRKKEE